MDNLSVGSIVYILAGKEYSVLPCRITKVVTTHDMEGKSVSHMFETPKNQEYCLEDRNEKFFRNLEEARVFLTEKSENFINEVIKNASKLEAECFGTPESKQIIEEDSEFNEKDSIKVDLDGITANVILPEALK